jgi:hypothetical protein
MMKKLTTVVSGVYLGKTVKPSSTYEGKTIAAKSIWNLGVTTEGGQEILNISSPLDAPTPTDYSPVSVTVTVGAYNNQLYCKYVKHESVKK